jgi:hypothetical protein
VVTVPACGSVRQRQVRERPADDAFSALEACRREQLGFAVAVTAADAARFGEVPT